MENQVLAEIRNFAVKRLNTEYGFCGCADGPNFAMLNSTDTDDKDIIITIKIDD